MRVAHVANTLPGAAALDQPPVSAARPVARAQAMNNEAGPAAVPTNFADQVAETRVETGAAEDEAKLRAAVNSSLRHDLQRYFRYPPLARRMGWQGEVWLRFDLHDDGAIAAIQVARSSGYDLLDEDAVHTLQQVAHLTTAAPGRRLQGLEIPVIYRLTEG
jgi:protein TonB